MKTQIEQKVITKNHIFIKLDGKWKAYTYTPEPNLTIENSEQSIQRYERAKLAKYCKCSKIGRQWTLEDYCKYCTIEVPEDAPIEKDPCHLCEIGNTLREEQTEIFSLISEEKISHTKGLE